MSVIELPEIQWLAYSSTMARFFVCGGAHVLRVGNELNGHIFAKIALSTWPKLGAVLKMRTDRCANPLPGHTLWFIVPGQCSMVWRALYQPPDDCYIVGGTVSGIGIGAT